MLSVGAISFLTPWVLAGLIALPLLWWLLRAIPPAPAKRVFPGVRLLLGLQDPERMPERTPWWLLALRIAALAAAILAFAEPVLNPRAEDTGRGPLLIVLDGGWASAPRWTARMNRLEDLLDRADRTGRPVAVHLLTGEMPGDNRLPFRQARDWVERIPGLQPSAWSPDRSAFATWLQNADSEGFETIWMSDGLGTEGDDTFLTALQAQGDVTVVRDAYVPLAVTSPQFSDGAIRAEVLAPTTGARPSVELGAIGPDPQGIERVLGVTRVLFDPEFDGVAEVTLDLPVELRNRVSRLTLAEDRSAGAVALADDGLRRRKVGLISGAEGGEAQQLISPLHYLRKALEPSADLIESDLANTLNAAPDVIVMADVGAVTETERDALVAWLDRGGMLVRFAGPRLAASGEGQLEEDDLLPVRLRAGGRTVGGAMSWGAPKTLRDFPDDSPFAGLSVPAEVAVTTQVMAQPDPFLPERVMAALEDGTPLVTGKSVGEGRVVLFHVTANAEWSSLPLSGLFVSMLERLAVSSQVAQPDAEDLEGQTWVPQLVLDGFGTLTEPGLLTGIDGSRLVTDTASASMPPGIYGSADRTIAVNLFKSGDRLAALGPLPAGVGVTSLAVVPETPLKPWLLIVALCALLVDILATLWLSGRLTGPRLAQGAAILMTLSLLAPGEGWAQSQADEDLALYATANTVLAFVQTGDSQVDAVSEAGLNGLSDVLIRRTAVEPAPAVAVNLERDELAFYPFLYWPITERQDIPSDDAYARLNQYLRSGGMILFDTRDANLGRSLGSTTANGRMLQRLAAKLDIPPLEPAPMDHVLTRTFYLLQDFPGRHANSDIWVEAAPNAEEVEGLPFRNLNDGVTPVVIGGNDWASAWAMDASGNPMFPVGRGRGGVQQREMAYRFGVNLIMHVMTGNYKSDQVHVPALLERLGN